MTNILDIKNILRQVNLDMFTWEELEDSDSEISQFVDSYTYNFTLKNLNRYNRALFLEMLEDFNNDKVSPDDILTFLNENIEDFEKRLAEGLEKEIINMKHKIVAKS